MIRYLLLLALFFTSCELIEEYEQMKYPGDYFSRTISYAKCTKVNDNTFRYELEEGVVDLHLNISEPYFLDKRDKKSVTTKLSSLHYEKRIDNSLRYLIREGMTYSQVKQLLGPNGEKWGGPAANMVVWRLADGRYLSIMPSTLEMPEGMNFYNILNERQRSPISVKLLGFGMTELKSERR